MTDFNSNFNFPELFSESAPRAIVTSPFCPDYQMSPDCWDVGKILYFFNKHEVMGPFADRLQNDYNFLSLGLRKPSLFEKECNRDRVTQLLHDFLLMQDIFAAIEFIGAASWVAQKEKELKGAETAD